MRRPTRLGMSDACAESRRERPLRELNRGTEAPGVEDVSTPAISNRARRRTQMEVHGSVRTRPSSARITMASKTPSVMSSNALPSPCRPTLRPGARETPTHGWREDTARDSSSFRAAYWHAEHERARESMENQSPVSLRQQTASDRKRGCAPEIR